MFQQKCILDFLFPPPRNVDINTSLILQNTLLMFPFPFTVQIQPHHSRYFVMQLGKASANKPRIHGQYLYKKINTFQECPATSTLQPTTENIEWLESHVAAGFRVWQIMFLCFACLLTLGNCILYARWVLHTRHRGILFFDQHHVPLLVGSLTM